MKKLQLKREPIEFPDDVKRIVRIFAEREYEISEHDAATAWEKYSEDFYCAGWLSMDGLEDVDIFFSLLKYFER